MSTPTPVGSWEQEGGRLAGLLDDVYATVVAAPDPTVAARVAIGIARMQGVRRRVAIADLVGECPPLEALLTGDDPHGISDSFLYGVSLNKIARPVGESGSVFVMPSGTESVANEQVYANERWRRLAAGFHQVGALLLVVAVPGTPGFAELCGFIGAVMPVADLPAEAIPAGVRVVAAPAPPMPTPRSTPTPRRESTARARAVAAENSAARTRKLVLLALVLAAIAVAIGTQWSRIAPMLHAPLAGMFGTATTEGAGLVPPTEMERGGGGAVGDSATRALQDSLAADSAAAAAMAAATPLVVENPSDSARASRFAIFLASANTPEAAIPEGGVAALPAVAMTPVVEDGERWYRLTIGAAQTRRGADALLRGMRDTRVLESGNVVVVPYTLRLEDAVDPGAVRARLAEFRRQGLMPYALRQTNGRATIVTGAFETPMQARVLADSLQKIGITPVLVYRTGRTF